MQTQKWIGVVPEQVNQFKRWAVDNHDTVSVKQDSPDGSETGTVSGHKYIFNWAFDYEYDAGAATVTVSAENHADAIFENISKVLGAPAA